MRKLIPLFYVLIFLSFIPAVFSQSSDDAIKDLKKRYPTLMKTYGNKLQNLEVEYIVAIDLSKSMNKTIPNGTTTYIDEVKKGIIQFLNAIPDNSKISIIGFGTTVRWVQIPTIINDANRIKISSVLADMKADEDYTDLKGAVNFLIEGCSSVSTIKYLFAFTDFNNDPPAISPFSSVSWEDMQKKYALISKTSLIETFALKLPIAASSGRDLPSIRMVFPGLNVIEFDAVSLQSWFSDRCGKIMEQNLWTFVSKDLKNIQNQRLFNLKAQIGLSGQINVTSKMDSMPEYIEGLSFMNVDDLKLSYRNEFVFSASEITRDKNSCTIGSIKFKYKANPLSFNNELSGLLKGKMISSANEEINRLYAVVSLKESSLDAKKEAKTAESYMTYSQDINASSGFIITWPLWVFIGVALFLLIFIVLLVKNSILPNKLKNLGLFCESQTAIVNNYKFELPNKQTITIGNESSKFDIVIKEVTFKSKIFGKRGSPFNLLVRRSMNFGYSKENVGLVELNGKAVHALSFKIKLGDKIKVHQGASFSFVFIVKKIK